MSLLALALVSIAVLVVGYIGYGAFVSSQYRLDDAQVTPAQARNDGVDFVPTRPFYLLSQHFSAIAAAGPIAGPILACAAFGWLPCVLWILLGVVFIGAVHDFSALVASIRHGAHSVAEIAKETLGRRAGISLIVFIWLALLYVIIAFTQITAASFVGKSEEMAGITTSFNKGGAVAMASTLYLALALVMGLVQRFLKPPMWLVTLLFVPATLGCVWAGTKLDGLLVLNVQNWYTIILVYCLIASLLPMWVLQQPRGYLGGFVLYLAIGVGVLGILFGGYEVKQPMLSEAARRSLNPLAVLSPGSEGASPKITDFMFPFLFVTIACGACSGFHGLICGGTTSKQIAKESHCKPVAFGAMLLEGFVAIIALSTIMILSPSEVKGLTPARIYGDGLASYLTLVLGKDAFLFCATFGAMAFSTFVFDTLDVSTRLGRYLVQELFGVKGRVSGVIAAAATAGVPLVVLMVADATAYQAFWTLFGTSNQLLAALTLLGVTVWLYRNGRRVWYTLLPMVFVLGITVVALLVQIVAGARDLSGGRAWQDGKLNPTVPNAIVASLLLAMAVVFVIEAVAAVNRHRRTAP